MQTYCDTTGIMYHDRTRGVNVGDSLNIEQLEGYAPGDSTGVADLDRLTSTSPDGVRPVD